MFNRKACLKSEEMNAYARWSASLEPKRGSSSRQNCLNFRDCRRDERRDRLAYDDKVSDAVWVGDSWSASKAQARLKSGPNGLWQIVFSRIKKMVKGREVSSGEGTKSGLNWYLIALY